MNPPFEMDNRSKRSIVLDLATDDGRGRALELLADADVFVTNVRPGCAAAARARLRCGRRPQTRAWSTGSSPGTERPGPTPTGRRYDVAAFWARGGLAHLLTRPGDMPPFQRGGMGDHSVGMTLAAAVCAALVARSQHRARASWSRTSLYRQGAYTVSFDLNTFAADGPSDRDRPAGVDGQPVHEQLRRRATAGGSGSSGCRATGTGPRCAARSVGPTGSTDARFATRPDAGGQRARR